MNDTPPSVVPVADHAVLVTFNGEITDGTLARIHALDSALSGNPPSGMVEIVPALTSLLVVFDPIQTDHALISTAVLAANLAQSTSRSPGALHRIAVCYEHEHSPDLSTVAELAGLTTEGVINAHLAASYTVGMYGFAPGFAYLYGTPLAIGLPRNPTPGPVRPAGSIIIAGQQCMIIPTPLSTGWFAIGRSPEPTLTENPAHPFLFDVGDTVTFSRIDSASFERPSHRDR